MSKRFAYMFIEDKKTTMPELAARHGQQIEVLRPLNVPEEADEEVGPMFRVRFPDGYESDVFVNEIEED